MNYPQRKRNRLADYDYSENGAYFITICTENKKRCLSYIQCIDTETQITLTRKGQIVERFVGEIPIKYPTVSVDHYVIMPNHVHLLLRIDRSRGTEGDGTGNPSPTEGDGTGNPSPTEGDGTGNPSSTEGDGTGNPSPTEGDGTGNPSPTEGDGTGNPSPTEGDGTGNPSPTVGNVIGWFKYQTTKAINEAEKNKASFWQRSYFDHVIRDETDYRIRWNYIDGNPARWAEDKYYSV